MASRYPVRCSLTRPFRATSPSFLRLAGAASEGDRLGKAFSALEFFLACAFVAIENYPQLAGMRGRALAAKNKCLADNNKSCTRPNTTNKSSDFLHIGSQCADQTPRRQPTAHPTAGAVPLTARRRTLTPETHMRIRDFLNGRRFDAETVRILGVAFEQVCVALQIGASDDDVKRAIANKVIALAENGERNPDLLCEGVLADIRRSTDEPTV